MIDRRKGVKYGLVGVLGAATLAGMVYTLVGGPDELIPPGDTTATVLLQLLSPRDMGHLPARSEWCSLVRDAEHCWLLQESSGDATDYGTPGGWHLSPTGSPRRAVPAYVPVGDGSDGIAWDEVGVGSDHGGDGRLFSVSSYAVCDATKLSITYLFMAYKNTGSAPYLIKQYTDTAGFSLQTRSTFDQFYFQDGAAAITDSELPDGNLHCKTFAVDVSASNQAKWYMDGVLIKTDDASGFVLSDGSTGPVQIGRTGRTQGPIYRVRMDCGVALTLADHQALCGSLYQDPSDAYSDDTEIADADAGYTQSGGTRCYQTEQHAATCIPGDKLGWGWSSTLDASGFGYGYGWALEPGRTNRVPYSSEVDCTTWTCTGTADATSNNAVAPDGSYTATTISIGDDGVRDVYTSAGGYTGGATLYPLIWVKCSTTDFTIAHHFAASGQWTIDCSVIDGEWELLTADHPAVTVMAGWMADASGENGYHFYDADGTTSATIWLPTLTETQGLSVIPTEAAAVATGDPSWEIDNASGDYYSGNRGMLTLVGDWSVTQPVDVYDASDYGRSYGDSGDWYMHDSSGSGVLRCDADLDGYTEGIPTWILQWDSASYVPGYSRHGVCTISGTEQSYTTDATSSWTPATPDTIKLWSQGSVGILHELKIEAKP